MLNIKTSNKRFVIHKAISRKENYNHYMVNGREMEDVEEFLYLGATVDKEDGGSKDIMNQLQKARSAFQRLGKVWGARGIGRRTKIRLFKTLHVVRPVLLYGCEMWKITKADKRKLNITISVLSFVSRCSHLSCRSRRFHCLLLVFFRR